MFARAKAEAIRIGKLKNSIRNGDGNLVGCIGEQAFLYLFPGAVSNNTYQHDITYDGLTIECKTKQRRCGPQLSFEASVANYNTTQKADVYAFMSVTYDQTIKRFTRAHFCGFMPPDEYMEKAYFREQGQEDTSNGFNTPAACYNLHYSELYR